MTNFIKNIELYFNDNWQMVLKKGTQYLLSPSQMIEIFYYYYMEKNKNLDRDSIMYKMSDISMAEMVEFLKKIEKEVTRYMS